MIATDSHEVSIILLDVIHHDIKVLLGVLVEPLNTNNVCLMNILIDLKLFQ